MRFNAAQQQAIESTEQRFAVVAPAGSGKTTVLAERFVNLVQKGGLSPNQILTVTFTRKAAAEMKSRIVNKLNESGLRDEAQVAETGPIQTIHSFYHSLVRENAVEAGVDPELTVMDDVAKHALLDRIVAESLVDHSSHSPETKAFLTRFAGKVAWKKTGLRAEVESIVVSGIMEQLRGSRFEATELWSIYRDTASYEATVMRHLHARFDGTTEPKSQDTLTSWWAANRGFLPGAPTPGAEMASTLTVGATQLALTIWQNLESAMRSAGSFDHNMMESFALRLVSGNPEVSRRLRSQYKALLVDESQDVNPLQHAFLDACGIEQQMYVGDLQQSIYMFRQADPEYSREKLSALPTVRLSQNYRSTAAIVRFTNKVFSSIWSDSYASMDEDGGGKYDGVQVWDTAAKPMRTVAANIAAMVESGQADASKTVVLVNEWGRGIACGKELARLGIAYEVLGATTQFMLQMEVSDTDSLLTACADPRNDFALACLLRSPFVGLSLDAVVVLAAKEGIHQRLSTFQPELEEDGTRLGEFLSWFGELHKLGDRLAAWEVITEALKGSGYFEKVAAKEGGEQSLANMRKILEKAASHPELGPRDFAKLIQNSQAGVSRENDASIFDEHDPVVKIQTIHGSKGLEYSTVVLADLPDIKPRLGTQKWLTDLRTGLVASPVNRSPFHSLMVATDAQSQRAEINRLLYVAMTRAKENLCLCVPVTKPRNWEGTVASEILKVIGYPDRMDPSIVHLKVDSTGEQSDGTLLP